MNVTGAPATEPVPPLDRVFQPGTHLIGQEGALLDAGDGDGQCVLAVGLQARDHDPVGVGPDGVEQRRFPPPQILD